MLNFWWWEWSCEWVTLPGQVASAASLKQGHTMLKFDEALSDKIGANVLLQSHGGYVQDTVPLPLQQVIQLLFQENLTHIRQHLCVKNREFEFCSLAGFLEKSLTLLTPTWYEPFLTGQSLWSIVTQFSPSAGGESFRQSRALYLRSHMSHTHDKASWILK